LICTASCVVATTASLLFRLVSFIRRLSGRARIFKRGRAKSILRGRTSLAVARRSVTADAGIDPHIEGWRRARIHTGIPARSNRTTSVSS
jgi:hypothetical protein